VTDNMPICDGLSNLLVAIDAHSANVVTLRI
jgi:hypothetical protein